MCDKREKRVREMGRWHNFANVKKVHLKYRRNELSQRLVAYVSVLRRILQMERSNEFEEVAFGGWEWNVVAVVAKLKTDFPLILH